MKNEVSVTEMRGPLGELQDQCSGENGRIRFEEFKLWLKGVVLALLEHVTTVKVPAIRRFSASDVLGRIGVNKDGIRIGFLGRNFQAQFGSLVEENVPEADLAVSCLKRYADALEIAGAVSREKRIVKVSQIYQLVLIRETGGQSGLRVDGWADLFLAYGADGNLWLVDVDRCSDGWRFYASPLDCPGRWFGGHQVFSRK